MTLRVAAGFGPSFVFEHPHEIWAPSTLRGAIDALRTAQRALQSGHWIAGAISYEFGAQLHGITARTFDPLLVLGAFDPPRQLDPRADPAQFALSAPLSRVPFGDYERVIRYLLGQIRDGEVYQVNYTVPFDLGFSGDPFALFSFLAPLAQTAYSAYVEYADRAIVSISPELFLEFSGERISTKPMKGTAPLTHVQELATPKNRAEHVMIVDLLRNDLTRVCDNVQVERLFEVERYPTFATMTSTISGKLRAAASLEDVLRAAFPCGSVTGAPKRAAMQHIARVERESRGFYTGTVGFLSPQNRGWWNVPIRTLHVDAKKGRARYDAGGGIVSDSQAAEEWNEILIKSRFLAPAFEHFALLETFRAGPHPGDVQAHLRRLEHSAAAFNIPLDVQAVAERLAASANAPDPRLTRVRATAERVEILSEPLLETQAPVDLCLSGERVLSDDPLLQHKTSWRPVHEKAAREARARGCFDAILLNERGEVTEGARTNIFIRKGNTLYTPPLECGVLPGILRSRLVAEGQAVERVLTFADLASADAVFAGNSARGLLPARIRMNDKLLYPYVLQPKLTEAIWGGESLVTRFGKSGDPSKKYGESWECWDTNGVLNGPLAGCTVADLRERLGTDLVGTGIDPAQIFPVLTKIITAQDSLSVQVHPDDAYAQRVEHQQNGKTECWYVLEAEPGAELVMGWANDTSRREYERRVADGTLGEILQRVKVKAGDAFYIPAGRVHAIGAGIVLYETQQASDLTYRMFDWNRVGADGKPRELHIQKAADVLNYQKLPSESSLEELTYAYEGFQRTALIAESHFLVECVTATEAAADMSTHGRPLIITSLGESIELACDDGTATLWPYQTALVPAQAKTVSIQSCGGPARFMCIMPSPAPESLHKRFADAGVAQAIIERFLRQFQPVILSLSKGG